MTILVKIWAAFIKTGHTCPRIGFLRCILPSTKIFTGIDDRDTRFATTSVTRLLNYVFNIWPFSRKKICTISQKFAKAVVKFCQIQNKPSKNCLKLNFFPKVTKIRQIWPHRSHWSPKPAFVNCRSLHILFISLPSLCSYSMGLHYPLSL